MSYPQFGYSYPGLGSVASSVANSQILVPGSISTPTTSASSSGCCESGRPVYTDPHTGQTICSCQYSSSLFSYPRVPGLTPDGVYPSHYSAGQGYMGFSPDAASLYSSLTGAANDGDAALRGLGASAGGAPYPYPYDPTLAAYSYGPGYGGMDINGSRRKNATRETTATLKAWLYEHRKNPYPTKGEKIMLAIITKMTLTQVSTWFANARRRLKKENKMTWSPRNRCSDDADDKDDAEDKDEGHKTDDDKGPEDSEKKDDGESAKSDTGAESPLSVDRPSTTSESPKQNGHSPAVQSQSCDSSTSAESQKPRIWSLADVATSEKRTSTSLFGSSIPNLRPSPNGGFKYLPPLRGWMDPFIRANGGSPYPPMPRPSIPSFNMANSGTPGLGSVNLMSSSAVDTKPNPFMAAWNSKPMPAVEPTVDSATNAGLHEKSDKAGEGDRREDNEQTKTAFKPVFKRI